MPPVLFNQGEVTAADQGQLPEGSLLRSVGAEYRVGDALTLWRHPARQNFGNVGATAASHLYLAQFDTATGDRVVALSAGTLYGARAGEFGSFSTLESGLTNTDEARQLIGAHYNDRHYLTNGVDRMRVLEQDGTVRKAGMVAPPQAVIATPRETGTPLVSRPTVNSDAASDIEWFNEVNGYDGNLGSFAYTTLEQTGDVSTITLSGWGAQAGDSSDKLYILYAIRTLSSPNFTTPLGDNAPFRRLQVGFEVSENGGAKFTEILSDRGGYPYAAPSYFVHKFTTAPDRGDVQLRITLTYKKGFTDAVNFNLMDVAIQRGSAKANFSTTSTGMQYVYTEYDQTRGLESPPSPPAHTAGGETRITLTNQNEVEIANPSVIQNDNATHIRWYRLPDGGVDPFDYGMIGVTEIGGTKAFIDIFGVYNFNEQPDTPLALIQISVSSGDTNEPIAFFANVPPPKADFVINYDGALVGFDGRVERYSIGGLPESWPELYVINTFPLPEHDEIIGAAVVDRNLILGGRDVMIRQEGLPRLVNGVLNNARAVKISGAPGLVNRYAIIDAADDDDQGGLPRCVWVSPFGVHETDGFRHRRLTNDIDWAENVELSDLVSFASLFWDKEQQQIRVQYADRRYALIHMSDEHRKPSTRPKITWGHYGRITNIVGGFVENIYRIYSGHRDNGSVYRERVGMIDASNAKGDNTWPYDVESREVRNAFNVTMVRKARLRHSDAGAGETVKVTCTAGLDDPASEQSVIESVEMDGNRGTMFGVILAGDWHRFRIQNNGDTEFGVQMLELDTEDFGQAGEF